MWYISWFLGIGFALTFTVVCAIAYDAKLEKEKKEMND